MLTIFIFISSFLLSISLQRLIPSPHSSLKNDDLDGVVSAVGYVRILWRENDIKRRLRWQKSQVKLELA
jgi:hypothetical protein